MILDDTGFPKQGMHSVGVQRQYSGPLGKIGNCQIAVTAALWTGVRAWLLGAELYLPQTWLTRDRRQHARIPARVVFQEKWRLALTLVDRVRRAGIDVDLVTADAGYGDILEFRVGLEQRQLPLHVAPARATTGTAAGTDPPRRARGDPRNPHRAFFDHDARLS